MSLVFLAGWSPAVSAQGTSFLPGAGENEMWMGTYFQGKKLGFSYGKLKWSEDSIDLHTRVFIKFKAQGIDQTTSFSQKTSLTRDLQLKNFSLLQEIMGHRQNVEGDVVDGRLHYRVRGLGFDKKQSMAIPENFAPSASFLLNIMGEGLEVGKKGKLRLFLESFQIMADLEYEILRKEEFNYQGQAFETFVIFHRVSGMESTLWVTPTGIVMRELTNQGFESRREPKETAQDLGQASLSVSNLITFSLVKPQREIAQPEKKRKMKLKISGIRSPDLIPQDHRQRVLESERLADGSYAATLLVSTEPKEGVQTVQLPFEFSTDPDFLEDSVEVQSKHPMIRALARELSADTTDAWKLALRINRWVFRNLEKSLVDTVTALDALNERRGECQSHTFLYTAIARAAGIPTKVVNGLVYSPQYKGFLYHAWAEVYVGEWRALDPTFGQDNVDATHIKLTVGQQEGVLKMMEFIGKINIELIEN